MIYLIKQSLGEVLMKDLNKDIEKCIEINIQALVDAGYIKNKDDMSEKDLEQLRKIIEHNLNASHVNVQPIVKIKCKRN